MKSHDKKPERIGFLIMLAGYAAMVTKTFLFPDCL
jgi:hypothetical protein